MTEPVRYAIPSHARADRINRWSLRALADAGVPAADVDVFVAPDELPEYSKAMDRSLYGRLLTGALGLQRQHRAIECFYGDGARVVQLDDDLGGIVRRANERKLEPCTDLPAEAADAFALCADIGARLWGVYPTANAGWMKPRVRTGLVFVCGGLFGRVIDTSLSVELGQKEDYERTLRYWSADGVVARVEWLGMRTAMYRPGGLQAADQPDRGELNEQAVRYLLHRWPQQVRKAARVGKAGTELRLHSSR